MKAYKFSVFLWLLIGVGGGWFIIQRRTDAAGAANPLGNQLVSLGLWCGLGLVILGIHIGWYRHLKHHR